MGRKPWEIPIQYNDDRFEERGPSTTSRDTFADGDDDRDERDIEELLNRGPREEREYECNDATPIDYSKGPHDEEFGVEDRFDTPDPDPVPYGNGPSDEEFGLDDDEG